MRRAILRDADLRERDLTGAQIKEADLIYTDLRGADMTDAELIDTDLFGARLEGAILSNADITDAELSQVQGLTHQQFATTRNGHLLPAQPGPEPVIRFAPAPAPA